MEGPGMDKCSKHVHFIVKYGHMRCLCPYFGLILGVMFIFIIKMDT